MSKLRTRLKRFHTGTLVFVASSTLFLGFFSPIAFAAGQEAGAEACGNTDGRSVASSAGGKEIQVCVDNSTKRQRDAERYLDPSTKVGDDQAFYGRVHGALLQMSKDGVPQLSVGGHVAAADSAGVDNAIYHLAGGPYSDKKTDETRSVASSYLSKYGEKMGEVEHAVAPHPSGRSVKSGHGMRRAFDIHQVGSGNVAGQYATADWSLPLRNKGGGGGVLAQSDFNAISGDAFSIIQMKLGSSSNRIELIDGPDGSRRSADGEIIKGLRAHAASEETTFTVRGHGRDIGMITIKPKSVSVERDGRKANVSNPGSPSVEAQILGQKYIFDGARDPIDIPGLGSIRVDSNGYQRSSEGGVTHGSLKGGDVLITLTVDNAVLTQDRDDAVDKTTKDPAGNPADSQSVSSVEDAPAPSEKGDPAETVNALALRVESIGAGIYAHRDNVDALNADQVALDKIKEEVSGFTDEQKKTEAALDLDGVIDDLQWTIDSAKTHGPGVGASVPGTQILDQLSTNPPFSEILREVFFKSAPMGLGSKDDRLELLESWSSASYPGGFGSVHPPGPSSPPLFARSNVSPANDGKNNSRKTTYVLHVGQIKSEVKIPRGGIVLPATLIKVPDSVEMGADNTITIPEVEGVDYKTVDDRGRKTIITGKHTILPGSSLRIIAEPKKGFKFQPHDRVIDVRLTSTDKRVEGPSRGNQTGILKNTDGINEGKGHDGEAVGDILPSTELKGTDRAATDPPVGNDVRSDSLLPGTESRGADRVAIDPHVGDDGKSGSLASDSVRSTSVTSASEKFEKGRQRRLASTGADLGAAGLGAFLALAAMGAFIARRRQRK